MRNRMFYGLLIGLAAVLVVGCAAPAPQEAPTEEEPAAGEEAAPAEEGAEAGEGEDLRFVYVSPNPIGVNEFLIMGETGIEAAAEQFGAEFDVLESEFGNPVNAEENVRAAIDSGANIVMVLGFEFNDIIPVVAEEFPDVDFLIVDQCIDPIPANVHCAVFREYEGSFLAGAIAGSLTETGKVGAIGALDIPFLYRYTQVFVEGAQHVNPDVDSEILYVGGDDPFADPARAKELALAMAAGGADYIYAAAAGGNFGIFEAAEEEGFFAFGIDVNQCPDAPGFIVDNMMKQVDVAIVESITNILEGDAAPLVSYGLAEGGINLIALEDDPSGSECLIADNPDLIATIQDLRDQIVSGELTIEDPMMAQ